MLVNDETRISSIYFWNEKCVKADHLNMRNRHSRLDKTVYDPIKCEF